MSTTLSNLIDELRRRAKDVHPVVEALTVGVQASGVTRALLEVTQGHLIFTGSGGGLRSFDLDLTNPLNSTIGLLHDNISRMAGMVCVIDNHTDPTHPSVDIESFGPRDIASQGTKIRHRVFSNEEIVKILEAALRSHNPSMSIYTVPAAEFELTLTLAQAMIARELATDSVKRKNTTESVNDLLSIARSFEEKYERDNKRLARVIQSPTEGNANRTRQGDVMMGTMVRRSLRTGVMTPMAGALPVSAPELYAAKDGDCEDDNLRISWDRSPDPSLAGYELWMDTTSNVVRSAVQSRSGRGILIEDRETAIRSTSSIYLGSVRGESFTYTESGFSTYLVGGSQVTSVVVGLLEPTTDYYFRLFALSTNGEASASEVVGYRTRSRRTKFASSNPALPISVSVGNVVTLRFDTSWAAFTTNHILTVGGKIITPTIVTGYQITFITPTFFQKGYKQLVVTSPDGGLQSILKDVFKVV